MQRIRDSPSTAGQQTSTIIIIIIMIIICVIRKIIIAQRKCAFARVQFAAGFSVQLLNNALSIYPILWSVNRANCNVDNRICCGCNNDSRRTRVGWGFCAAAVAASPYAYRTCVMFVALRMEFPCACPPVGRLRGSCHFMVRDDDDDVRIPHYGGKYGWRRYFFISLIFVKKYSIFCVE